MPGGSASSAGVFRATGGHWRSDHGQQCSDRIVNLPPSREKAAGIRREESGHINSRRSSETAIIASVRFVSSPAADLRSRV
jgi:hypothetical protein